MTEAHTVDWWSSLSHEGLLIGPSALKEFFPEPAAPPTPRETEALRRALSRWESGADDGERLLLSTVLETICGFSDSPGSHAGRASGHWLRGTSVPTEWTRRSLTGEAIKPRALWQGEHDARLPVFVATGDARLGVGRGKRTVSRVLEWLRATGEPLALLTNFRQWSLLYAGLDFHARAQSDAEMWFEGGQPAAQLVALRTLLSPETLIPARAGEPARLLGAIRASRKGQAELSGVLGERVRQAVERLIDAHGDALGRLADQGTTTPREIYLAATRVIMRLVVVLFAEARDLLPRDTAVYHGSYSLEGLRDSLFRSGGDRDRLQHRFGAWPRVLGLFRLVREGSHHPELEIPRYGGELFAPGDPAHGDGMSRALAVFEEPEHGPDDATVYEILHLLTRSKVKVRQGRKTTWIETAVDFSSLSSEYIGILYEGLLDFELRRSAPEAPVVFLNLGKEPALPLSRLEAMNDRALKSLLESVKKEIDEQPGLSEPDAKASAGDDEEAPDPPDEGIDDEMAGEPVAEENVVAEEPAPVESEQETNDAHRAAKNRTRIWARRAAEAARLVRKPRARSDAAAREYDENLARAATGLIRRVVVPGEWYIVRWGGTRKGAGTFYTRPQLAVPTVHRTLRPLAYTPPDDVPPEEIELLSADKWQPRRPEEILALKVCDPAMGSASFLVGALRFLTDALYESLFHHSRIRAEGDQTLVTLLKGRGNGEGEEGSLADERLPARPDDERFEERLRARLKRYVVERCLYGVDIDPLAVELARLALWVETMDRDLPFEFLDHKLKPGNSLIGTWFDRFRDYPVMAWERDGGDKTHTTAVHHEKESWTKVIKTTRNHLKRELADAISGQTDAFATLEGHEPDAIHDQALAALEHMHRFAPQEVAEKTAYFREHIAGNPAVQKLKEATDTWCAIWFWPADALDHAPTPKTLDRLSDETRETVRKLARTYRFFHWELEFPDVFKRREPPASSLPPRAFSGFDAVLGNPPWDIQKSNSKEYFSNIDPLYRGYGKQEALDHQRKLFEQDRDQERAWLKYNARFKALSNWCKHAANPFGDPELGEKFAIASGKQGDTLHQQWRDRRHHRKGYADSVHPFQHQGGGDINTYKLFLENSHALLRPGGRLGMICPSGLYTDKGTTDLRTLFVVQSCWRWLFGFENREKVFEIDSRFKFGPVIVEKGGKTDAILTAFMHRDLGDWERAERYVIPYPRAQIEKFSPKTRALLEIRAQRDLEVLDKIYSNAVLLGDDGPDGWGIKYTTEFHMTNDSHLFKPRPWWEERGYRPDAYGRWIGPDGDVALPLYEGRMIDQFDFSAKAWASGKGRTAVWADIDWDQKRIRPQYLMTKKDYMSATDKDGNPKPIRGTKVAFMDVTSATNKRTMVAALGPDVPFGNSVPVLKSAVSDPWLVGVLNSFSYDYATRARCGGLHLNYFVLSETPLPFPHKSHSAVDLAVARLAIPSPIYAPDWLSITADLSIRQKHSWYCLWALTEHERLRLRCTIDAISAAMFGLQAEDLRWILKDCEHPATELPVSLDPKGFWRVDKDKNPELRHTILTIVAFRDLQAMIDAHDGDCEKGVEAFCNQNDGEGWMLPEALCLADLGLGHDDRAKHPQPVRERMGPRFYEWQFDQSVEESWAECERHARNILGDEAFDRMMANQDDEAKQNHHEAPLKVAEPARAYTQNEQERLF